MIIETTSYFDKKLAKKIKKNPKLNNKFIKQTTLLLENMKYPSLKLHKLSGKRAEQMSFWIEGNLRVTFIITDHTLLFTDLLTHDEY